MATVAAFEVATKVLIDQGQTTLRAFISPENAARVQELVGEGLEPDAFKTQLETSVKQLEDVEASQERAKQDYLKEAGEDQALAEKGYRWVLTAHAKARSYLSTVEDDPDDIAGKLRFGHLRSPRARGVTYEMRILLPELEDLAPKFAAFGAGPEFVAEGKGILTKLGVDMQETTDAKARREEITRNVRKQEIVLSRVLRRLVAADEAAAIARIERSPAFRMDVINAELGRLAAQREARLAGRAAPNDDEG